MKCLKCNAELPEDTKICPECKADVEAPMAQEADGADGREAGDVQEVEYQAAQTESAETEYAGTAVPETEAAAVPVPEGTKPGRKKMSAAAKAGICAAAAVVVAGVGFAAFMMGQKDPKTAVIDAFKSVYAADQVSPMEEIFGFEELSKNMRNAKYETGMGIKLESSQDPSLEILNGGGIRLSSQNDIPAQKSYAEVAVEYNNMDLLTMNMYLDASRLMASVPELSSKVFFVNYADDLAGQMERSPVFGPEFAESEMDIQAFGDYMDYIWSFYGEEGDTPFNIGQLWERYKEGSQAIDDLKAAMTAKKAEKAVYTVDGAQVKCQGYEAVLPREAIVQFLDATSEFFMEDETLKKDMLEYVTQMVSLSGTMYDISADGQPLEERVEELWMDAEDGRVDLIAEVEKMMGDVAMTVYVDKKGRMAALDAETTLTDADGNTLNLTLHGELKGGAYLTQNAELELSVEEDGDEIILTILKQGVSDEKQLTCDVSVDVTDGIADNGFMYTGTYEKEDGAYDMTASVYAGGRQQVEITVTGAVENLVKGKSVHMEADYITISAMEQEIAEFSGYYSIDAMEGEVTEPEGSQMDVLAASESEWQDVLLEIQENVYGLLFQLQ